MIVEIWDQIAADGLPDGVNAKAYGRALEEAYAARAAERFPGAEIVIAVDIMRNQSGGSSLVIVFFSDGGRELFNPNAEADYNWAKSIAADVLQEESLYI